MLAEAKKKQHPPPSLQREVVFTTPLSLPHSPPTSAYGARRAGDSKADAGAEQGARCRGPPLAEAKKRRKPLPTLQRTTTYKTQLSLPNSIPAPEQEASPADSEAEEGARFCDRPASIMLAEAKENKHPMPSLQHAAAYATLPSSSNSSPAPGQRARRAGDAEAGEEVERETVCSGRPDWSMLGKDSEVMDSCNPIPDEVDVSPGPHPVSLNMLSAIVSLHTLNDELNFSGGGMCEAQANTTKDAVTQDVFFHWVQSPLVPPNSPIVSCSPSSPSWSPDCNENVQSEFQACTETHRGTLETACDTTNKLLFKVVDEIFLWFLPRFVDACFTCL